jgi:hypothetical protein
MAKSANEQLRAKHYKGYKVLVQNNLKADGDTIFGETDTKRKTVKINVKKSKASKRKGELSDSLAHEFQHVLHPSMSEKQVYKRTAKIPQKQKSKLLKYIKK